MNGMFLGRVTRTFKATQRISALTKAGQFISRSTRIHQIIILIFIAWGTMGEMAHARSQRFFQQLHYHKHNRHVYLTARTMLTYWIAAIGLSPLRGWFPQPRLRVFTSLNSCVTMPQRAQAISRLLCAMMTAHQTCCSRHPTPHGRHITDTAVTAYTPRLTTRTRSVTTDRFRPVQIQPKISGSTPNIP